METSYLGLGVLKTVTAHCPVVSLRVSFCPLQSIIKSFKLTLNLPKTLWRRKRTKIFPKALRCDRVTEALLDFDTS